MTTVNDTVSNDMDALDPPVAELKLSTGTVVRFQDLKTRQFFRLLRIITRGAGPLLMEYRLDGDLGSEEFIGRMLALVFMAVPEAEDEAIAFIQSMVSPDGLVEQTPGSRALTKREQENNEELWDQLRVELFNPPLEDTFDIIEAIVKREAKDIQSLGKRLQRMFEIARKTGQVETPPAEPEPEKTETSRKKTTTRKTSSEDSLQPST